MPRAALLRLVLLEVTVSNLKIYGRHPILEALRAGATIRLLHVAAGQKERGILGEILDEAQQRGVRVERHARTELDRMVEPGANHQGIVAEMPPFRYRSVDELLERAEARGEAPLLLLLDSMQDVQNVGALLRTAEAAGVHGAIIPERRAAGVTAAVYKSSAGALHHLPVAQVTNLARTIQELQARNVWFVGLDMAGDQHYHQANLKGPLGIVVGAEDKGLGRLVAERCDFLVRIPMRGKVASLNASVAGGILLYEAVRQRG